MADFDLMELAPDQLEDDGGISQEQVLTTTATTAITSTTTAIAATTTTAATTAVATGGVLTSTGEAAVLLEATKLFTQQVMTTTNVVPPPTVPAIAANASLNGGKYGNGNTAPEPVEGEQPAVVNIGPGEVLKGRSVVKKFGRKKYAGQVMAFDAETKWYKVVYDDGDEEELEYKELEKILVDASVAEQVKSAAKATKKRPLANADSDAKSPSKKQRGRKPSAEKAQAKEPKSPKAAKTDKPATPKKSAGAKPAAGEVSEVHSMEKKKATEPTTPKEQKTGGKKGRGRPKKEDSLKAQLKAKSGKKGKADGKASGESSSESKPSTRKTSSTGDQDDSKSVRSPRAKAKGAASGGSPAQTEGAMLIGSTTKKKFGSKLFSGEIIGYDPKAKYYKVRYEDGDVEELTIKEIRKTLVTEEGQSTPTKTRAQPTSPGKTAEESPAKKQKVATPKKADTKTQSPAGDGAQPKKRGRPAKAKSVSEISDQDKGNDEDSEDSSAPALLAAVRFATSSSAEGLEYFGWGEIVHSNRSRCVELMAAKLMPTSSPIVHLTASQHHLAALTAAGQVLVWRNQHGNIHTRCDEWEHISDLEGKGVVFIDIGGPDINRKSAGYSSVQEDQVPDPFYLAAVCSNGDDYLLQGSQPQEPVRTQQLCDAPKIKGLRMTLAQTNPSSLKLLGKVVQASVGIVEAPDETPFIGYITDTNKVYVRSATKAFMDEVNLVTGYTGNPLKIQCGGVYHAIILTDNGQAWTWGNGDLSAPTLNSSSSLSGDQSPYGRCHPALGTLVGRKVLDVGCYGEDFVALTSDGDVHQWTRRVSNPAGGIPDVPSIPSPGQGPCIAQGDKLKHISIGVGVCAGITELGQLHTWRTFSRGVAPSKGQGPGTPLGREAGANTAVPSVGTKVATKVICVAGSMIVVAEKKSKLKPAAKIKSSEPT